MNRHFVKQSTRNLLSSLNRVHRFVYRIDRNEELIVREENRMKSFENRRLIEIHETLSTRSIDR